MYGYMLQSDSSAAVNKFLNHSWSFYCYKVTTNTQQDTAQVHLTYCSSEISNMKTLSGSWVTKSWSVIASESFFPVYCSPKQTQKEKTTIQTSYANSNGITIRFVCDVWRIEEVIAMKASIILSISNIVPSRWWSRLGRGPLVDLSLCSIDQDGDLNWLGISWISWIRPGGHQQYTVMDRYRKKHTFDYNHSQFK